ncbi:UNVERIFIED_ORG: hypothetical protein M2438_000078 [Methylobacterium sp. SuP10 SLI 274]|uniref:hypothetical protein n=1 Tax=Methylorubrum extorquens TaxID=408 RepID=UPI0020A0EC62|nr:hypothetical protein [Methylorubrum extorquens]MDF9861273.1 hypothetical protein [Methylorubrum pseudosasae]MDH6634903.1 hypothetical protein [Methylobacterium sp. SuP10 SLI 274]MDH6664073.1 hypothetical protein [Methylorubrum zatmanii]MCP1561079.1 hypothetical protein [Methylorubrum extorquens]MDF9789557.1 hypothetical protein [Methylorubrum extorquens]
MMLGSKPEMGDPMSELMRWLQFGKKAAYLTVTDSLGLILIAAGALTLLMFTLSIYKLISHAAAWRKGANVILGIASLCLISAGPAVSLLRYGKSQEELAKQRGDAIASILKNDLKPHDISERLRENRKVKYVIRLISYDPTLQPELALDRLSSAFLGPPQQRFTFVGDYDELKGYTAAEAVRRTGLPFQEGQRVTAVIFPVLSPRQLLPVNARGLLQLIDMTEANSTKMKFDVKSRLSKPAYESLSERQKSSSWAFEAYKRHYGEYCEASFKFVCNKSDFNTSNLIGNVTHDWHPLGFARSEALAIDPCDQEELRKSYCIIKEWPSEDTRILDHIGSRVFMTENSAISSLDGRILIDFNYPSRQKIPAINYEDGTGR